MRDRDLDNISAAFTEAVGKPVYSVAKLSGGLDNSVYYIAPVDESLSGYVLKIIESKPDEQIHNAILLSNSLKEFTALDFYQGAEGNYIYSSPHIDKHFIIMSFLPGRQPDLSLHGESLLVAGFIANLHNALPRDRVSPRELLQQEVDLISTYYSRSLVYAMERGEGEKGAWYKHRAAMYKRCHTVLHNVLATQSAQFDDDGYYITKGITHGDLNVGNMIIDDNSRLSFIDPDAMDRHGFQIVDVLHAISKSPVVTNAENTNDFLDHYLREKGDCNLDKKMINILLFSLSFRSALSTDYYTENIGTIPKISTEWVYDNARNTLDTLMVTLEQSIQNMGITVGAFLINQTIEHVLKQESKVLADQSTQQQDGFERRLRWAYDPEALRYEPPAPEAWQAWAIRQGHEVVASSQATLTQGAHWVQHNGREALTNSRERLTHSASWLQQNALTPAREGLVHSAEWLSRRFTTAQVAPTETGDLESGNLGQSQQSAGIKLSEAKGKKTNIQDSTLQMRGSSTATPQSRVIKVESDQQHNIGKSNEGLNP